MQKNALYKKLASKAFVAFERAEPNISIVGLFSVIGYPLFYFIWTHLLPQPYENLGYRLINALIGAPLLFYTHFAGKLKKYFLAYFFIALLFLLPFFFGFMLYKNAWNITWFISNLIALFLLILIIDDWVLVFLLSIIGYSSAFLTVLFLDGQVLFTYFQWLYVPTFLFLLLGGVVGSHRKQLANQTKISLLHSLSASIAHEMRNPLNSIINAMGSVQSILPNKPGRNKKDSDYVISRSGLINLHNVVEESTATVLRANKIIDSILTDMQGKSLDPQILKRTTAKNSIQSAVSSFSYSNPEDRNLIKNLVSIDFDFFGDKDLLVYVLFNLIKNALYYKDKPGFTLEISTETTQDSNIIKVYDTGPGIPPSKRERIFDSFYTFGKDGGIGLGLSFSKRVISSFRGTIVCNSQENEWTEFVIRFPFYNSKAVEQLKKEIIHQKSVLVVDKNHANRLLAKKCFREWSCNINEADNGAHAFSMLSGKKFDLILIDLDTLAMKGIDAAGHASIQEYISKERIAEHKNVPIIGMSALPEPEAKKRALSAGVNGYIGKPLTREHVVSIFEDHFFSENKPVITDNNIILNNKSVLIVDDDFTSRKFMNILLERMGANVIQAENGELAIKCLEEKECDIVFMDMEMPVLNGISAAAKIREGKSFKRFKNFKEIPIIALSGNTDAANIASAKQSGMNDHIGKPISKDKLVRTLSFWLRL